jgi:integrase
LRFVASDVDAWLQRNRCMTGLRDSHEQASQQRHAGVEPGVGSSPSSNHPQLAATGGETFAEAARTWLARKQRLVERSTYEDYRRHLTLRLIPAFGSLDLPQITRARIEEYVAELDRARSISPKTINDSLIPLRQVLARGVRDGMLATNVALSPDRDDPLELPCERPIMRYLNRAEARRYLKATTREYRALAEVLIGAGLRISEALALTWGDISWDSATISVTKSFKVGGLGSPKGDRGRNVTIDRFLLDQLRRHGERVGWRHGLVFSRTSGERVHRQWVHSRWHRPALARATLPKAIRLHDLRHTAATLWLASGESIYFVQQQLGHKDIQTTISLYGHPDQAAHRQAAERAANWWRGDPS